MQVWKSPLERIRIQVDDEVCGQPPVYIYFGAPRSVDKTIEVSETVKVDVDEDGRVVGIEVL